MPTKLTQYFTIEELTKTDIAELKEKNYNEGVRRGSDLLALAQFAENIRRILQSPIIVLSGFRCPEVNAAIGGSLTSQHCKGEAIDFIPKLISAQNAFALIRQSDLKYGQLILEKRGAGHLLHASIGDRKESLYSPKAGVYERVPV
jgi:hypothetical protein